MSDRDEFGAFFMGFMFGSLMGAIVALLLTPQAGAETRALIKDKSIELRDRAQQSAAEALARADELARQGRERGQSYEEASEPTNPGGGMPGGGETGTGQDQNHRSTGLSSYDG